MSSCGTINSTFLGGETEVRLNQSIFTGGGNCINSGTNNFVLDCQGYLINSTNISNTTYGFYSNGYDGITIQNCNIKNFGSYGIYFDSVVNSQILNSNITYNGNGIYTDSANNNNLSDLIVNYNTGTGIFFASGNNGNISNVVTNFNNNGIFLNYGGYNTFYNLESNNNTNNGIIFSWTSNNNIFYDSQIHYNDYGIYFNRDSNNHLFLRGDIRYNNVNIYYNDNFGQRPYNNTISQIYIGNISMIGSDYNFTNSSYSNLLDGNYWDDFVSNPHCGESNPPGTWSFCDNNALSSIPISTPTSSRALPFVSTNTLIITFIAIILVGLTLR